MRSNSYRNMLHILKEFLKIWNTQKSLPMMCQKAIIPHNLRQPFLAEYLVKVHWLAIGKLVEKTSICGWDRTQWKLFLAIGATAPISNKPLNKSCQRLAYLSCTYYDWDLWGKGAG